ncbi:4164_t:CDS:2 [Paraglomus occultum]|uniref:4161_t:CDS:1 n=1 Tax=Paraglomus occultum TaxID=144539 RepID=A0A9N8ZXU7_9GLOM|nr:4161_t:CDS:2 [Paraglomus occultum]CAG8510160.1 4164_t:CDS:2 [Paraglomus occultum]
MEKTSDLMREPWEIEDPPSADPLEMEKGEKVSCRVPSGHTVAIVGPSGGKDQRIHERLMGVDANGYNVHYSVQRQRSERRNEDDDAMKSRKRHIEDEEARTEPLTGASNDNKRFRRRIFATFKGDIRTTFSETGNNQAIELIELEDDHDRAGNPNEFYIEIRENNKKPTISLDDLKVVLSGDTFEWIFFNSLGLKMLNAFLHHNPALRYVQFGESIFVPKARSRLEGVWACGKDFSQVFDQKVVERCLEAYQSPSSSSSRLQDKYTVAKLADVTADEYKFETTSPEKKRQ